MINLNFISAAGSVSAVGADYIPLSTWSMRDVGVLWFTEPSILQDRTVP